MSLPNHVRIVEVFDTNVPANPVKIRDFGLVGQQPGATGAVPVFIHGLPRTGTSALVQMLSLDDVLRGLRQWEQTRVCPPPVLGAQTLRSGDNQADFRAAGNQDQVGLAVARIA